MKYLKVLLVILFALSYRVLAQGDPKDNSVLLEPANDFALSTLSAQGLDEEMVMAAVDSINNGVYSNIHSLLILKNNKLVFEKYFEGEDAIIGVGRVGIRKHDIDSLHDIRSITKSIVGAAVLIAVANGQIESLDEPIINFFPEFEKFKSEFKNEITIKHLLTMTDGLEWDESISYADTTNSGRRLDNAKNPIEYYLSRQSLHRPGTVFNYSAGCTQTLAAIVKKCGGLEIDEFVNQNIFQPLGITTFEWVKRKDGTPIAASGLRMLSRDLLKFGLLYLNNGNYNGVQIIPETLAIEIQSLQFQIEPDFGYGYQIWITTDLINEEPLTTVEANGNGGQIIAINKKYNMVIVITAGNYNRRDLDWDSPVIYLKHIYPAVIE
jgi:CubicO group peptidase (beta-lactamase class C family)